MENFFVCDFFGVCMKWDEAKGLFVQMAPTIGMKDQSTQSLSYPKLENFSKLKNLNGPKWTSNVLNWLLMVQVDQKKFKFQFYIKKNPLEPQITILVKKCEKNALTLDSSSTE